MICLGCEGRYVGTGRGVWLVGWAERGVCYTDIVSVTCQAFRTPGASCQLPRFDCSRQCTRRTRFEACQRYLSGYSVDSAGPLYGKVGS
jgi:hypothetical protein